MPDLTSSSGFLAELKRRRVFRVAAVYAIVAWLVIQVAVNTFPALQLPGWTVTFVVVLTLLGLPIALVLAWAFDFTPDGVRRAEPRMPAGDGAGRRRDGRAAGWIGVGIVAGLAFVGAYGWFASPAADDPGAEVPERSIAVLPFENMSDVAENEYFSDGITEDILTQLAQVRDLSVVSRTSVMKYKGTRLSVPEIARELGVSYILEGSVRRAGDRVLVTAQLIDATHDDHLWAEQYDRDVTDIFAVQGDVAAAIAQELQVGLTPGERGRIETRPTENMDAYDLVLRSRELVGESRAQNELAVELLEQAIRLDPRYSDAYAALSGAFMQRVQVYGFPSEMADSGVALARRAIDLDQSNAAAWSALGTNLVQLGRDSAAGVAYRRALELNPSSGTVLNNLGSLAMRRGRVEESVGYLVRARRLDPRSSYPPINLAQAYAVVGDTVAALRWFGRSEQLGHDPVVVGVMRGVLRLLYGDPEPAMRDLERLAAERPGEFLPLYGAAFAASVTRRWERMHGLTQQLYRVAPEGRPGDSQSVKYLHALALGKTSRHEQAATLLEEIVTRAEALHVRGEWPPIVAFEAAGALALLGRTEDAMEWLDRIHVSEFVGSRVLEMDAGFDSLRTDARYVRTLTRIQTSERDFAQRLARLAPRD